MITQPRTVRAVLLVLALLMLVVFVGAGYGMILLPMGLIVVAVMLGAAGGSRQRSLAPQFPRNTGRSLAAKAW